MQNFSKIYYQHFVKILTNFSKICTNVCNQDSGIQVSNIAFFSVFQNLPRFFFFSRGGNGFFRVQVVERRVGIRGVRRRGSLEAVREVVEPDLAALEAPLRAHRRALGVAQAVRVVGRFVRAAASRERERRAGEGTGRERRTTTGRARSGRAERRRDARARE